MDMGDQIWRTEESCRLDKFLASQLPDLSRTKIAKWIQETGVTVDGVPRKPSFELKPGMIITAQDVPDEQPHDLTPHAIALDIVYEDAFLLVINKPRGMATHPAPGLREATLVNALLARDDTLSTGSAPFRPGIVHRLDKDTTGLLIVAKTDFAHRRLAQQIATHQIVRRYVATCEGELEHPKLVIDSPIARDKRDRRKMAVDPAGKSARTHLTRITLVAGCTVFVAQLETGRTHQIRVHLQAIGHPIVGDPIYGKPGVLQLHAASLRFKHPMTNEEMVLKKELPEDFVLREFVNLEEI